MSKHGFGHTGQRAMAERWESGTEKREAAKRRREEKKMETTKTVCANSECCYCMGDVSCPAADGCGGYVQEKIG